MQLKSASNSPPKKQRDFRTMATGSRLRKKHKRLDAICEIAYNQNHNESKENNNNNNNNKGGGGSGSRAHQVSDSELRRSSRVRRPPVFLDVSPSPVRKRGRIDKNASLSADRRGIDISSLRSVKEEEEEEEEEDRESGGDLDSPNRRYQLRSRGRNVAIGERRVVGRRRKLFDETDTAEGKLKKEKEEPDGEVLTPKSKGLETIEAAKGLSSEAEEAGLPGSEEVSGTDDRMESAGENDSRKAKIDTQNEAEEGTTVSGSKMDGRTEGEQADGNDVQPGSDEEEGKERSDDLETEKKSDGNDDVGHVEHKENKVGELEKDRDNDRITVQADGALTYAEDGGFHDETGSGLMEVDEMPGGSKDIAEQSKLKLHSIDTLSRPRIKQGRSCGLCGCGNDGKPPKRLIQDAGESENEAYSGSSASEEHNYDIWDGFGDEPGWLGQLLGPINDRYGIAGIWVHQHCAVWSPEVYFAGLGCLKNVRAALCRGRALKCSRCGRPGATIGCRVDRCPKTYHLPCARISGCIFDHRKFLIACTDHRHYFQPHGSRYFMRIKKLKAMKMKLEMRKLSNDAWRKDVEAEEKWLENCGEDEEFLKRESKRLHRDLLRIAPVYIGGAGLDNSKLFEGWESVAGLQDVIQCMKEVVILPLLYPEFFGNLGITPPRGVLLHGYPGTGKTLVVRALIGSCARGDRRIAYFARKGADCLGKYVGDAERQLRLLFQVAERCQPSIIFFDEIDGLAPCRTRQQDQTHSSVVSTLLALMDGLKSRGSVIVIGATNRPEAVDPALRRPGRFDREIYFPLPSVEDRAAILSLHTKRWPKPVTGPLLKWIARRTVGFAGADLQALCTQAAILALKRNFPLQEVLSAAEERASSTERIPLTQFAVEERDWLEALACAPPPCSRREAGIAAQDLVSSPLPMHLIPCFLRPLSALLISLYIEDGLWMPPPLLRAAEIVKSVILSSLKKKNLPTDRWWSYVNSFLEENDVAKEIQKNLSFAGILIGEACCAGPDASSDGINDDFVESDPFVVHNVSIHSSLSRSISFASRRKSELRVLISGDPRSGQRHLASCILNCFVGNVEIQKIDLATISQEAHGDMVQGITQMLMKCACLRSCMIFMPRIDLWALETCVRVNEGEASSTDHQIPDGKESRSTLGQVIDGLKEFFSDQCNAAKMAEPQGAAQSASHAWGSFVEQMESISVSTSFIILATSEHPYTDLPYRIRQFFESQTAKSACSTPLQHTSPRFHVHVDGNFNHDAVISLSAAKLSRDVIQLYVQLVYQRAHSRKNPSKKRKICDAVQGCVGSKCHDGNLGSISEEQRGAQIPCSSSLEISLPLSNRILKGKSSLLLAISTFGYQILRYPHFAELCWVTSKLKEGPCADVGGPWKGWPFNSCIFRPANSSDEVAVACSSNGKGKDRSGLVRGLIAVGLLAYRGMYKSLREVSFEVRKVLELLVARVNEKIQSGKDRHQYLCLLSQVAYLEDAVNSWVYALQSLELDAQPKMANPKLSSMEYPNNYTCLDTSVQSEDCNQKMFNGNSHAAERPEGVTPGKLEGIELSGGDGPFQEGESNLCEPDQEGRAALSENVFMPNIDISDHNKDEHLQGSMGDNQAAINMKNERLGNTLGPCDPEPTIDLLVTASNSLSWQNSNGCRFPEPVVPFENVLCNLGESAASKFSGLGKFHCQINGLEGRTEPDGVVPEHSNRLEDTNSSPGKFKHLSTDSGITCFYCCCSRCLDALHGIVLKILACEWQKNESSWTAEHVHNVVSSLSMDLLSAVRKVDSATNISKLFDESLRHHTPERISTYPGLHECHCNSSDTVVVPMECSCHSVDGCATGKASVPDSQFKLDPEFVLRDGILVPVDSNRDASFHCKYESLCLCPLVQSIVMMKQPFD